jgi:predicted DsbA family dithiol-disulfide isomerase
VRVDIWSDLVCPWCYVGKRRFEQALAAFEHRARVEVVHRSFQLNPGIPRGTLVSRDEVLMRKYGLTAEQLREMDMRMEQTAAAEGLEYHLAGGKSGSTFDAHRLLQRARDLDVQDALIERFYRAYFTERQSLFDTDSLTRLAVEAGLPPDDVYDVLASETYADAVRADIDEARAFGATGVPFFVFAQRYRLSGAQPPATFMAALTRAWSETHAFVPSRE